MPPVKRGGLGGWLGFLSMFSRSPAENEAAIPATDCDGSLLIGIPALEDAKMDLFLVASSWVDSEPNLKLNSFTAVCGGSSLTGVAMVTAPGDICADDGRLRVIYL